MYICVFHVSVFDLYIDLKYFLFDLWDFSLLLRLSGVRC